MILFESGGIVAVALLLFWVWALFDCVSTDASLCRNLPKGVWIVVVLLLPDIGSLLWLLLGRPERAHWRPGSTDYSKPRRPVGLEDHPRYSAAAGVTDRRSAELDARLDEWQKQQHAIEPAAAEHTDLGAWEADLKRRELELRQRELERRERDVELREHDDG